MLIVNKERLDVSRADDTSYHLREQAQEYRRGLKQIQDTYPDGQLVIVRTGYPKFTDGIDSKGFDVKAMIEPTPPAKYPLSSLYSHHKRGKEVWGVCMGEPKILPGNLWDIGDKRSFTITDKMVIDIKQEPDLAFFLVYICNAVKGGHLKIDNPKEDAKKRGNKHREEIEIEIAIWHTLSDDDQLKRIASSWGVAEVDKKEPDQVREELRDVLKANDDMKKRDLSYKGTKEFLEEMKITDSVRLNSFLRHWLDEKKITLLDSGQVKIGDKTIAHIPADWANRKFVWLCNYFFAPNNLQKLQELMKDLVNKEYLDTVSDEKDFRWLAKVMEIKGYFNQSSDKVKEMVIKEFVV
jgi:hypothetical protein